jgi:endo-1,4-beta-xylanase
VNDYQLDAGYLALLESLREQGRWPFDVVGLQAHMHDGPWALTKVWELCETYRVLGLPLHFSEITVLSGPRLGPGENWGPTEPALEARQAEYAEQLYTLLFSHPAVGGAIWWDLPDWGAWQHAAAGLLRRDMTPKPAYERLHALIKQRWWTRTNGVTDARGEFRTQVYRGLHRVTVTPRTGHPVVKVVGWEGDGGERCDVVVG